MIPSEIKPLIEALMPIKDYLSDIVLIGGWIPLLNKFYNSSYEYDGYPVLTQDVDLVCPRFLPTKEEEVDELLKKAGFESQISGFETPSVCKYIKSSGIEIEFLTPMRGNGSEHNINVQNKLSAQSLRYLDILLDHTVFIVIPEVELRINTPELSAFIYQKGLSFPERTSELKKAKDLYYIYQVLDSVSDVDSLIQRLKETIFPSHPQTWIAKFNRNIESHFRDIDDIGVDLVFRQIQELPEYDGEDEVEKRKIFRTFSDFIRSTKS